MTEHEWAADCIEVSISGFFTTRHSLETATGLLGELTVPGVHKDSTFRGDDGRELVARQPSWWKQEHEICEGELVLGTAWPRGFFHRQTIVEFDGQSYTLDPAGFWTRAWHLLDSGGNALLKIEPRGVFRRGAYISILGEVPVDLLVFAYYLVHKRWQTEKAAAAAS